MNEEKVTCSICNKDFKDDTSKAHAIYKCECGQEYCSDFPYREVNCLKCRRKIKRSWLQNFKKEDANV